MPGDDERVVVKDEGPIKVQMRLHEETIVCVMGSEDEISEAVMCLRSCLCKPRHGTSRRALTTLQPNAGGGTMVVYKCVDARVKNEGKIRSRRSAEMFASCEERRAQSVKLTRKEGT